MAYTSAGARLLQRVMHQSRLRQGDTRVVFRVYKDGDVIALFPDLHDVQGITSYMHIGQHGAADYGLVMSQTKPATVEQYAALARELQQIGYTLIIRSRR
jgi:hypothetical protein